MVSIVITTYNRSTFLMEAINSIANQSYKNIEILLIDDGSTREIANENKRICEQFPVCQYYYKANTGQPDSRNYGIKKCKGKYLGFCDDDDCWAIDKLEKQLKIFEINNDIAIVTGCTEYIEENGRKTGRLKCHTGHNHGYVFKDLLVKNRTASITPLIRREVIEKVGLFNNTFTYGEDWEFWRRVSYYYKFYALNETLAYVRMHPKKMTLTRSRKLIERMVLFRKLNKTLLKWGKNKFSNEDKELIEYIEWCHYRRLIQNNLNPRDRIGFVLKILFMGTISPLYLINLYIKYNSRYEPQK